MTDDDDKTDLQIAYLNQQIDQATKQARRERHKLDRAEKEFLKEQAKGTKLQNLIDGMVAHCGDTLRYNIVSGEYEGIACPTDGELHTIMRSAISVVLKYDYSGSDIKDVLRLVGMHPDRRISPIKQFLSKLEWDGTKRIGTWLFDYCGVERSTPAHDAAVAIVGERWLIALVARGQVLGPAEQVQADNVLVLEGPQGLGKTELVRALGGDWYSYLSGNLADKDSQMGICRSWVVELAELSAMRKTDSEALKDFITRKMDSFRPPYGGKVIDYPRHCLFIATVNPLDNESYLKDETGNRRYWPVVCTKIELDKFKADRDQLLAEAMVNYKNGVKHWVTKDEQDKYIDRLFDHLVDEDPWADVIRRSATPGKPFMIADVLNWLDMSINDYNKHKKNIATSLRKVGAISSRVRYGMGNRRREWVIQPIAEHSDGCGCETCCPF